MVDEQKKCNSGERHEHSLGALQGSSGPLKQQGCAIEDGRTKNALNAQVSVIFLVFMNTYSVKKTKPNQNRLAG